MKKIVVFNGSPRKNGYTTKLLAKVVEGAKSEGASVMEFDLNDPGVRGCQSCFYCRQHDGCSVKDYLTPMYEAINEADGIVFGSPIYYYQITGQARLWLDRTFPMVGENFSSRHPGKKVVTIFTQGSADPKVGRDAINFIDQILHKTYGWTNEKTIHCLGTTNGCPENFEELSAEAYKAGQALGK